MKVGKLKKFDAAEHLRTPEARAEYLNIVLADGDPAEVRDALNLVARAQGMSVVAKAAGVTREGLYKTLGEEWQPGVRNRPAGHRGHGNPACRRTGPSQAEEESRGLTTKI